MNDFDTCGPCQRSYDEHCSSCYACPGDRHDEYCEGDDRDPVEAGA